jgi:hypothetical protein
VCHTEEATVTVAEAVAVVVVAVVLVAAAEATATEGEAVAASAAVEAFAGANRGKGCERQKPGCPLAAGGDAHESAGARVHRPADWAAVKCEVRRPTAVQAATVM